MLYYKLEILPETDLINVLDIVEEKKDDGYIYATSDEFKLLKQKNIVNYLDDLRGGVFGNFNRAKD